MKAQRNILLAFLLNLAFSVFEFVGGILTGSIAILSDAVHDMGDAAGIGLSFFLEKKSQRLPDSKFTYGYARFSVLGGFVTTLILLIGSLVMICSAFGRILSPTPIHYDGMVVFAMVGVCVNSLAALFTHGGSSLNQRSVNLHMLEDVLGWVAVLIGAIVMRFVDIPLLDPIMSMGVSVFILGNALKNLKEILAIFLEKAPHRTDAAAVKEQLQTVGGVLDVHHIHLWSMDGQNHFATMHIVTGQNGHAIKDAVRKRLAQLGIDHATLELEEPGEHCHERHCPGTQQTACGCHHHHHGH